MEPTKLISKPVFYTTITALIISLLFTGILLNQRNNFKEELGAEKLQTESLTQSREILQLDIVELESSFVNLTKTTEETQEKASFLNERITLLEKENLALSTNNKLVLRMHNKQKQIEKVLEETLLLNEKNNTQWKSEKENFQRVIQALEKDKQGLLTQLESRKTVAANYFRIEALKKKGSKQSRKASKTSRILVSFSWSEALTQEFMNRPIYLTLTGPGSSKMTSTAMEKILITMDKQSVEIPVVAKAKIQSINKGRQEIIMTTKSKLSPGVYQADVYTDNFHLGGAQIKLD